MPKNNYSDLIASVKSLNIGFINKYIINSGIGGGTIQYWLLPITSLKYLFISSPPNYFSLLNIDEIDYSV